MATALIVIDIQKDYFPGGAFEQEGADAAAANAAKVIAVFRKKGLPVVHIRHENLVPETGFFLPGTDGAEIHPVVAPQGDESVILKHYPNSFLQTDLQKVLESYGVKQVVMTGMMTLMCIDATTRAASDLGYDVTVLHDACAARALSFNGVDVPAAHVHAAFLAALQLFYAQIESASDYLHAIQ